MAQQKVRIDIPRSLKPDQRIKLGFDVINYIQERTTEGRDKDEDKFPKYTKEYAEFKGSSVGDVDLTFTGDMLLSLDLLKHGPGFIEIGYPRGDAELNGKVEGNRIGSYGGEPDPSKARDFLGIDDTILESLIDTIDEEGEDISEADIEREARRAAEDIIGDVEFEDDE